MFDLEQKISEWREQMLAAGIKSPVPLDELEIHLREEIERQMKAGANEQKAFEISVQQIGAPQPLKSEFKKNERSFMKTLKICGGIFGLFIAAALMVPGFVQLHATLAVTNGRLACWLAGLALFGWSLDLLRQIVRPTKRTQPADKTRMSLRIKIIKIRVGVLVMLAALACMMPAAALAIRDGRMQFADLCYLTFGIALLIAGTGVVFLPYQKRKLET